MRALASVMFTFSMIALPAGAATVRVGAKSFTEQHIVAEIISQLIEQHTELQVVRVFDLGGTGLCHQALRRGELDLYVEYTGTALLDILRESPLYGADNVYRKVARAYREQFDLVWLPPLGFNNSFAVAVRSTDADQNNWRTISDLGSHADRLRAGFTSEFIERPDGYPGLSRRYGCRFGRVIDLDPGLMYRALIDGQVDLICAFSTDGRIQTSHLTILEDDRAFFPPYEAAPVVRGQVLRAHPEISEALAPLARRIDDATMRSMNAAVDEQKRRPSDVAGAWIEKALSGGVVSTTIPEASAEGSSGWLSLALARRAELLRKTLEHLGLAGLALIIALLIGVPLGVIISKVPPLASPVLSLAEIVQTVPSLAMLAFLFALYRTLGAVPAITALVLYSLLPIVLNTFTGLKNIAPEIREAAVGIGMSGPQRLRWVELPLAVPVLMAGIRTAAVWTIGIATLSTYIGAGGLGDFIGRGLARSDPRLTMLGAVPAAGIAILVSCGLRYAERRMKRW